MQNRSWFVRIAAALVCAVPLLSADSARAQKGGATDWPNWRGPAHNGSAATANKNLPVKFSPTENVRWSVDLPGPSAATPIVFGDNVFVSSVDTKNETLLALCFDRKTGKAKWSHNVGSGYVVPGRGDGDKIRKDNRSNYASPSPATDGKRVVFFYGNGDLSAFDLAGKKLWQRNLQKDYGNFAFGWTFSSSPVLLNDKLYMQILQNEGSSRGGDGGTAKRPSFLLCLNPQTGAELWRSERPTAAVMESREAFTTPIPHTHNGQTQLLIAGGDFLTGHDPKDGKELWRWGTWNEAHREGFWRLVPSPVAGGGVVLVCAPKRAPVYAAKLGQSGTTSGLDKLAWKSEERSDITSDVPTPLFYNDKFYILSDLKRMLTCVEPKTGKVLYSVAVPERKNCWASPTGADGKIYALALDGTVVVFEAATGKVLAENPMGDNGMDVRASIAVAQGNLFVRTDNKLFCIGVATSAGTSNKSAQNIRK